MVLGALAAPGELWAFGQVANAIQRHWNGSPALAAWWWLAFAVACGVAQRLLQYTFAALWEGEFRERAGTGIQSQVLATTSVVELARFEHPKFYDDHQRVLVESETRTPDAIGQVGNVLQSGVGMVAIVAVVGSIAWYLPLIILLPFLPSFWITVITGTSYWTALSDQTRERRLATYHANLLTQRASAEEVRLFGLGEYLLDGWRRNYWQTRDDLRLAGFKGGLREIAGSGIALTGMLLLCGWFVVQSIDSLSAGDATILVGAILSMPGYLFYVGRSLRRIGETSGFACDLRAFLALGDADAPSDHPGQSTGLVKSAGHIVARGLTFAYPGSASPVIADINLEISPGERIAIVGENGAGKTTLVKLLLGLYTPDRGTVTLDGVNVHDLPSGQRQEKFSAVFQQFVHYPWSLQENVTLGSASDSSFDASIQRAGLARTVADLLDGEDTVLVPELGGTDLSGGKWQRVAIARASWRSGTVLVLDEPTSALDPMAEVDVFQHFAALTKGTTTLFISHRLGMARLADRIIVIGDNRIEETGTHRALRYGDGPYARMWAAQARWYA